MPTEIAAICRGVGSPRWPCGTSWSHAVRQRNVSAVMRCSRTAVGLEYVAVNCGQCGHRVLSSQSLRAANGRSDVGFPECAALFAWPLAGERVWVARGASRIPPVTHPALPRRKDGTVSSTLAVHSTCVYRIAPVPTFACLVNRRVTSRAAIHRVHVTRPAPLSLFANPSQSCCRRIVARSTGSHHRPLSEIQQRLAQWHSWRAELTRNLCIPHPAKTSVQRTTRRSVPADELGQCHIGRIGSTRQHSTKLRIG